MVFKPTVGPILQNVLTSVIVNNSTTFDPTTITGLISWLDASDTSTIVSSGGAVSQINDKSGNSNNAVQATAGNQPSTGGATVNGLNSITFADASRRMTFPSGMLTITSGPWTILLVYKDSTGNAIRRLLVGELTGTFNHGLYTNTSTAGFNARQSANAAGSGFTLDTNVHCFGGRRSGTTLNAYRDGGANTATSSSAADTTIDTLYLGGGGVSMVGQFCEALVFNQSISSTDFNNVGNYLATKWGFTWTNI